MSDNEQLQARAKLQFREFLLTHKYSQTKERYAILRAVYQLEGIFGVSDLQRQLIESNFKVSLSALYVTIGLLEQANLIIRHPFSSSQSLYERVVGDRPCSYQICNRCHSITRITSRELSKAVSSYRPRRFVPSHRVVYVYGVCPQCEKANRKARQLMLEL